MKGESNLTGVRCVAEDAAQLGAAPVQLHGGQHRLDQVSRQTELVLSETDGGRSPVCKHRWQVKL